MLSRRMINLTSKAFNPSKLSTNLTSGGLHSKYVLGHEFARYFASAKAANLSHKPQFRKIIAVGVFTSIVTFGTLEGFAYYKRKSQLSEDHGKSNGNHLEWDSYLRIVKNKAKGTVAGYIIPKETLPIIPVSRAVDGPLELPGVSLNLFQYQTCPFCCKVRSVLDYFGLPYNVIEVDPVIRQQLKFSKYRKVPILIVDEKSKDGSDSPNYVQLTDSSLIISILGTYLMHNSDKNDSFQTLLDYYQNLDDSRESKTEIINKYFLMIGDSWSPSKIKRNENRLHEERFWREWTDNVFVHVISPNVYRTLGESFDAFNYFSEIGQWDKYFPTWERLICIYIGALGMYFVAKRLKSRHRLKDDVRQSLYDEANRWVKAIGKDRKFMGGDRPNLADLAVFGALSSFEGCEAFRDLLKHVNIGPWYYSVKELCTAHAGAALLAKKSQN